ncbi:MAG: TonB-dependent receptor [Gemmatimonadaceae bacterium]
MFRTPCKTLWLLTAILPTVGRAQGDSTQLPGVVITATRVASPLGGGIASVSVLSGAALRERGVTNVADALRLVPGVAMVRSGGPGAQTSLFLRGGESDYVRVLVDGVPMNDPGGAVDLASLTLDEVDRIEVVRGPTSVLYGSDAVTGVVQLFTRRAPTSLQLETTLGGGSHRGREGSVSVGGRAGPWSATGGMTRRQSDGILPLNNDYQVDVYSSRVAFDGRAGTHIAVSGRSSDDTFHYPTDGAGAVVDRNAFRTDRRTSVSLEAAHPLGTHVRAEFTLSALNGRGSTDDAADGPADTVGFYAYRSSGSVRRRVADTRLQFFGSSHGAATLGAEWSTESQYSRDSSNFAADANTFRADRSTRAAYLQWVGAQGRLQYTLGGRWDDNSVFGTFGTARVGASLALWRGAQLRGSFGNAFKAPTFLEQFNTAFSVGNRDLVPERSRGSEVGFTQVAAAGRLSASATWFDQRFRDLIQYTYVNDLSPNYFNVAAASARGLEVEVRWQPDPRLHLSGTTTLLRSRVDDAGFDSGEGATFVTGQRLLRRPAQTSTLSAVAQATRRLSLDASVLRVGARDDRDFATFPANAVVLSAYTRADLGAQFAFPAPSGRSLTAVLRAENAFGARYTEVANFPAPGRVWYVGVRAGVSR